jgi:hypothetical protein
MLRLLFALFVFAGCGSPAHAQQNLLGNPAFEGNYTNASECPNVTGEVAPGWTDNTCWYSPAPQIAYARDGGRSGWAQRITLSSGRLVQFAQFLPGTTQPGQVRRASVWLRSAAPMELTLQLRQSGPPYRGFGSVLVTAGPQWQRVVMDGVSLGGEAVLLIKAFAPGTFWIDDAELIEQGPVPTLPAGNTGFVPPAYFGMHFNRLDTPWPAVAPAKLGAVRVWDADRNLDGSGTGAQWAEINPAPGQYDWSGLDARVAAAEARGADVLYTLGGRTPRWASSRPDVPTPYGPGGCAVPSTAALWQNWVREIATRYRGRIRYWEVWNEPDLDIFYCSPAIDLIEMARLAREVLRQVDPQALLVSPAMSGFDGAGGLAHFLAGGGAAHIDIVAHHFYVDAPEDVWQKVRELELLLSRLGLQGLPVWNTEQGWIDLDGPVNMLGEPLASAYVARSLLLNWAYGLKRFYPKSGSTLLQIAR